MEMIMSVDQLNFAVIFWSFEKKTRAHTRIKIDQITFVVAAVAIYSLWNSCDVVSIIVFTVEIYHPIFNILSLSLTLCVPLSLARWHPMYHFTIISNQIVFHRYVGTFLFLLVTVFIPFKLS